MIQSYFSDPIAPADSKLVVAGMIVAAVLFIIGLLIPLVVHFWRHGSQDLKSLFKSFGSILRYLGLTELILLFLRFQGLRPFNYRGWALFAIIPFVVWLVIVIRGFRRTLPDIRTKNDLDDRYFRYLPKSKRR